jgi:uncharacterized membrane protein (UPF0127 family)
MRIFSFEQNNLLFRAFTPSRLTPYALRSFALRSLLFALCSLTVHAFGTEISIGAETNLKKVTIRKQFGSAHDMVREKTEETFLVEVIRDMESLKKGLSHRESMPEENGMLFVLDVSQEHAFWMKGMRFPLDIVFMGEDMRITEILENLQPCEQCPIYFPKERPAYALEINAGLARKHGLSVNDTMVFDK